MLPRSDGLGTEGGITSSERARKRGNEAPILITPRAIAQLARVTVALIRRPKKS